MRAPDFANGVERVKRRLLSFISRKHSDPVLLLIRQHREVDALFLELENTSDLAHKAKEKTLHSLIDALELHAEIEEKLFYPAAREADAKIVLEALEEHDNIKGMLRKLRTVDAWDSSLGAKLTVLRELVHHHVREEETQLFPKCEAVMKRERLASIGARMQERVEQAEGASQRKQRAGAEAADSSASGTKRAAAKSGAAASAQKKENAHQHHGQGSKHKAALKPEKHVKH